MNRQIPIIAVSAGDPAGVGPEVIVKALCDPEVRQLARWIVVGEEWMFLQASASTRWSADGVLLPSDDPPSSPGVHLLTCNALAAPDVVPGRLSAACGLASLRFVEVATKRCLQGRADAIVTAPINKAAVSLSGRHFTGHTEYIAELCGCEDSRMLLVNDRIRVVHVTTHCGLAQSALVQTPRVYRTITLGYEAMLRMGWDQPRLAVCGLNPHAGEGGLFGDEESRVIAPAIAQARRDGIDVSGPFPADTLFMQAVRGHYDMVVAMYHDQGHVPMKLMDFEHTVNVSLGLPIVRTSVDHGTAFDIAGRDLADPENMKTAMRFAVRLVRGEKVA